jgi:hypothetical protein
MATKKKPIPAVPPPEYDQKWRAIDDLRTLAAAAEIRADRARIAAAQNEAKRQSKAVTMRTKRGK